MSKLQCRGFTLTDEKIIVWSDTCIFSGDFNCVNSNTSEIKLEQSQFVIPQGEGTIENITSKGQAEEGELDEDGNKIKNDSFFCTIKILLENNKAFILEYDLA